MHQRVAWLGASRASLLPPGSSAGLPEKMTGSPASVVTVMTRLSASLCAVDVVPMELIGHGWSDSSNRYHVEMRALFAHAPRPK